jgi:hypothetical protein
MDAPPSRKKARPNRRYLAPARIWLQGRRNLSEGKAPVKRAER